MFDTNKIRRDFPIFKRMFNGKPLIYLDSAATSLKPQSVINAINNYYTKFTANVFRGIYKTSEEATAAYEAGRAQIASFVGARPEEVIFVRNASEGINLFAYSWGRKFIHEGDEVVASILEHHSNFVPWQQLAHEYNWKFKIWKLDKEGRLKLEDLDRLVTRRTKLLTVTAASNVLGTLPPIREIILAVKKLNPHCLVLVDAAQAVPHLPVNVGQWGADAIAFSGHKMLGPSGIGVLWAKREILEAMPPFIFGGDMIREVHVKESLFNGIPHRFEAGTPFIEGAIGMGAAASYLTKLGMENVRAHEQSIVQYALRELAKIENLTIYGQQAPNARGGVIAFSLKGIHPHDVAQILDQDNICIRVGFHCAQPLHEYLAIGPTARASFYIYNDTKDVDELVKGIFRAQKMLS